MLSKKLGLSFLKVMVWCKIWILVQIKICTWKLPTILGRQLWCFFQCKDLYHIGSWLVIYNNYLVVNGHDLFSINLIVWKYPRIRRCVFSTTRNSRSQKKNNFQNLSTPFYWMFEPSFHEHDNFSLDDQAFSAPLTSQSSLIN